MQLASPHAGTQAESPAHDGSTAANQDNTDEAASDESDEESFYVIRETTIQDLPEGLSLYLVCVERGSVTMQDWASGVRVQGRLRDATRIEPKMNARRLATELDNVQITRRVQSSRQ